VPSVTVTRLAVEPEEVAHETSAPAARPMASTAVSTVTSRLRRLFVTKEV